VTVSEVGEFGVIDRVIDRTRQRDVVLLGPGDDAAVVAANDGRVVASTDMFVEGRHFRRDWSSAHDVGRKAAAASIADITAMGAVPTGLLVGLACPADTPLDWTDGLAEGLDEECRPLGASVVGGDLSRDDHITISVTALGDLQRRKPVTRAGAAAGQVVALAGRLGWSAAGWTVLTRGFRSPRALVEAHLRPSPPYGAGPAAALAGATAMIDVSDGLLADLGHVATASGVAIDVAGAALDVPRSMADAAQALGVDAYRWVLTGGEDHALAATFDAAAALPDGWTVIGRVSAGSGVTVDGEPYDGPSGFDHFAG
jgi:thiamine-monophosphate kinase